MQATADTTQRRHLAIMFSDLSGSTRIAAKMEPETYADLLQQLRALYEQIIPRHGGEIVRIDGDGVLCIFGYPHSYEDAGRRATEAAIDLHNGASTLDQSFAPPDTQIRLHSGIHSGVVLLRQGDLVRGRFEILGDATNVAARLCDHAGADAIVVSETSLGADLPFFITGSRELLSVRGHAQPVPVYTVVGREPLENRFAARVLRGVAPFTGRAAELGQLEQKLEKCRGGESRIVAIVGPAGIGKTRLTSEFLERAARDGVSVHRSYCEAYLGAQPLQAFAQLMRSLLAERGEGEPVDEALLHLGAPQGRTNDAATLAPALTALLQDMATRGPIILSIDDWQWADDASRLLFDAVVAKACPGVMFLLSARELDQDITEREGVTLIPVPPLADAEADAAIEGLLVTQEPFMVERIRDHAGGSPLFIEEMCHALLRGEDALVQGDRSAWLDMLIQSRFARLPARQAELVKTASVIGHMIPLWLFEAVTGVTGGDAILRELADEDFLYESETEGTFRFKHIITRDAIYRTVGLRERQALHTQVAATLELRGKGDGEEPYLEALAYHHGAAKNPEAATYYAARAGDKAMSAAALDRAQAQYRAAMTQLLSLEATLVRRSQFNQLVQKFGFASIVDPSPEQLPFLQFTLEKAKEDNNDEGVALSRYWLGAILYGLGEARPSIAPLEEAIVYAQGAGRSRLTLQLNANLGQSHLAAGHYRVAEELLNYSIEGMIADQSSERDTGLAYALGSRGMLYADRGEFDLAQQDFATIDVLLGDAKPAVFGSLLTKRSGVAIWRGDFDQALNFALAAEQQGMRTRSRFNTMMSHALKGYSSWNLDPQDIVVKELRHSAAWFLAGSGQHRTSLCYGWLTEIMSQVGDASEARHYANHSFRRAREGDRLGEAMAARAMARLAAKGHGRRRSTHYLAIAYRSAKARESRHELAKTRLCEAELALAEGFRDRASPLLDLARSAFAEMHMQSWVNQTDAIIASAQS
jgi:class 3 adenylate cyclase/tetratricopeptide (TPR) repeat protein